MRILILLFLSSLLLAGSCKKEPLEPQLPPLTQEGKNILACKINGKVFIAEGQIDWNTFTPHGVDYKYYSDSSIWIPGKAEKPFNGDIHLSFQFSALKNKYSLMNEEQNSGYLRMPVDNFVLAESEFRTDSIHTGTVILTYFKNNIIAGTFEFDAIDSRGVVVHVTEGRFDISTK